MKQAEYEVMVQAIVQHYMYGRSFVYSGSFVFDNCRIEIMVKYKPGRKYWKLSPNKFKVIDWSIHQYGNNTTNFDPQRLLHYFR